MSKNDLMQDDNGFNGGFSSDRTTSRARNWRGTTHSTGAPATG